MFVPTESQIIQSKLLNNPQYKYQLHYGGARSGKTTGICRWLLWQCGQWESAKGLGFQAAIIRNTANSARKLVLRGTMVDVLRAEGFTEVKNVSKYTFNQKVYSINITEGWLSFPGNANIWVFGLDDEKKFDRILGSEFAAIYYNEACDLPYSGFKQTRNRAAQLLQHVKLTYNNSDKKIICPTRILLDCNPKGTNHWTYVTFFEGRDFLTQEPIKNWNRYTTIHMNPDSNWHNLSPEYQDELDSYTGRDRERFYHGVYQPDSEYALWQQADIEKHRVALQQVPTIERMVVAVDPALTANKEKSDKTGIITVAKCKVGKDYHYYVIDDLSGHYLPHQWAEIAIRAYDTRQADAIVVERNQGGDMVGDTIRNVCRTKGHPPIKIIEAFAKRGKILRAQPVSVLYEEGLVHHAQVFPELEKQMISFTGASDQESPNNLDALVYGIMGAQYGSEFNSLDLSLRG